ncbi:hypothetical protein C3477_01150 [Mycobacterium kansasii]|uniref:hypothetical protein n=1 Tax=Mycobacterium kansasii TaxID=1768 RepID=UPI000CDCFDD9|nr:hypothetical protein [Mycobacterium kansasii]POY09476.1 hypothetical protein C3477_01150 [Mycobacterium kansasii]
MSVRIDCAVAAVAAVAAGPAGNSHTPNTTMTADGCTLAGADGEFGIAAVAAGAATGGIANTTRLEAAS